MEHRIDMNLHDPSVDRLIKIHQQMVDAYEKELKAKDVLIAQQEKTIELLENYLRDIQSMINELGE